MKAATIALLAGIVFAGSAQAQTNNLWPPFVPMAPIFNPPPPTPVYRPLYIPPAPRPVICNTIPIGGGVVTTVCN